MNIYLRQTALILDACIRNIDALLVGSDLSDALRELALGTTLVSRSLDLGFGAAPVESSGLESQNLASVGTGVFLVSGAAVEFANSSPYSTSFSVPDWLGTTPLQNVYAFARVVASSSSGLSVELQPAYWGAASNDAQHPVLVSREISVADAVEMLRSGTVVFPDLVDGQIELMRMLASIDNYVPNHNGDAVEELDAATYVVDLRRPRGWGGLADESMGYWLQPPIMLHYSRQAAFEAGVKTTLYNLVRNWVNLQCWQPNFVAFWTAYGLPTRLKSYLVSELGIVVS